MEKERLKILLLILLGAIVIANLLVLDVLLISDRKKATLRLQNRTENTEELIRPEVSKALDISKVNEIDFRLICQEEISRALATISAQPKEIIKTVYQESAVASHPALVYVPLGGGSSTTVRDWQDSGSAEAYFDKADYSGAKKISFEVFLKVKHGAGEANVRLYDATSGVVISGSELIGGGSQFEKKSTGLLNLLSGNNLYKVQLRSSTGYEAYMEGPRLKIEY